MSWLFSDFGYRMIMNAVEVGTLSRQPYGHKQEPLSSLHGSFTCFCTLLDILKHFYMMHVKFYIQDKMTAAAKPSQTFSMQHTKFEFSRQFTNLIKSFHAA